MVSNPITFAAAVVQKAIDLVTTVNNGHVSRGLMISTILAFSARFFTPSWWIMNNSYFMGLMIRPMGAQGTSLCMTTSSVSNSANQQISNFFAGKANHDSPKQILSAIQQICFL
jgi:hypothetical protein